VDTRLLQAYISQSIHI